jgi:hypothetical protein
MHIPCRIRGTSHIFGHYIGNRDMEDAQGSYIHEDEVKGLHVSMGNVETKSNGHRSRVEPIELVETMRSLQKEVKSYREYNERMMRDHQEEILQSLNMMQKQVNKDSGTKQASSARQKQHPDHDRRDDHGGSRKSRSVSRHHHRHSPRHFTRRAHAHSRSESIPSVSLVKNQRRRPESRYFARRAQENKATII